MMKERIMAIVIGAIMLGSLVGYAFMQNAPREDEPVRIEVIIERELDPSERVEILRRGLTLIEFLYPENCTDCEEKRGMYESFVTSEDFGGYVVLSSAVSENSTADWIIGRNGDRTGLEDINNTKDLEEIFCDVAMSQPNICLLHDI